MQIASNVVRVIKQKMNFIRNFERNRIADIVNNPCNYDVIFLQRNKVVNLLKFCIKCSEF